MLWQTEKSLAPHGNQTLIFGSSPCCLVTITICCLTPTLSNK